MPMLVVIPDVEPLDVEILAHGPDQPLGQSRAIVHVAGSDLENREFIASEPCDDIAVTRIREKPLADFAQERVADRMTETVVDVFETVEVEAMNREGSAASFEAHQCRFELLAEIDAVHEARESIVVGQIGDLSFGLPALRDVLVGRDPTAFGHRLMRYG